MKVSLKWLRDYVDITLTASELAEKLTMAGLEADDIKTIGDSWEDIFVGEIIGIEKHPNADRLQIATVDLGQERCVVVCGAPNITIGQRVPLARLGAKLYDGHTGEFVELRSAKVRGVLSEGMICSEKELGISDNHEGIMVLPREAPIGILLSQYLGDAVLDISVTPNRPDCLCMIGIAREVAALTGTNVRIPEVDYDEQEPAASEMVSIEIADPDLCPRYCGAIINGVKVGPSPNWMQERLLSAGMRPINNIVDITNFVMMEFGQPLHAFDYEGIGGTKVVVRRVKDKERIISLDGESRDLTADTLVIADEQYPIAIAGVMGGAESEVTERTSTILLESANFNNASIRRTSFGLGLVSESSSRFDKGLSPDLPMPAIQRAIELMVKIAGGKAAKGIIDAYPGSRGPSEPILLSMHRASQVLGVDFGITRIKEVLESLGFGCEQKKPAELLVSVPYWRTDVKLADDLIEEVARIIGYAEIPIVMLSGEIPQHEPAPLASLRDQLRDILIGCGMQEVINYSLTSSDMLVKTRYGGEFGPLLRLANPMSREQEFLRLSLRGGLLANFADNERNQDKGIKLFEIGRVYLPSADELPNEKEILAGIIGGPRSERSWRGDGVSFDFFDCKGILETTFHRIGIEAGFEAGEDVLLFPGRTANILVEGTAVGIIGELRPDVADDFNITSDPVCFFEVELEKLIHFISQSHVFQSIPRFPGVDRDIALIVDADLPAIRIQEIIRNFPQVSHVSIFDVYEGDQVPHGKKSLGFSLHYKSVERTLTDEEVDRIQHDILLKLHKELGVVLRQ